MTKNIVIKQDISKEDRIKIDNYVELITKEEDIKIHDYIELITSETNHKIIDYIESLDLEVNGGSRTIYIQKKDSCIINNYTHTTNKDSSVYLGIVVAERVLSKVFKKVKRMKHNNHGYDFICSKGYKIDVKSAVIYYSEGSKSYRFNITNNKVADYFLLLAFNNREDLEPKHLWLICGTDYIRGRPLNCFRGLNINLNNIHEFNKYELTDKIERLVKCCDSLR